ncbi:DUF1064 domain-containing protein [Enterococcus gallinarum]|uniref:DUF1064 domain-containing protein n=1 Tax=Enterococcus gallinarum TaxID=1353 RepID=UPI00336A25F6
MRPFKRPKKPKYSNHKIVIGGIKFDSVAEAKYLSFAIEYAKANDLELRLQEKFELQPKYCLGKKTVRAITYTPDYTFWSDDKLVKVVDVKGMQTEAFKIKAKLFCFKYQIPLILAEYDRKTGLFSERIF